MEDTQTNSGGDINILARTLYGEARGEGYEGMRAVACVVMNRCKIAEDFYEKRRHYHPLFGDGSPASACRVPWQFSCWNPDDPNCDVIQNLPDGDPIYAQALEIASEAVNGSLTDITNGATYYYAKGSPEPKWAAGKSPCVIIGHHLFFNNVN